mgnify:CR=1 FL=1
MFQKAIAFSLIFLLSVNMFSVGILQLTYEANKTYFTQNFCVNKAKPKLKCNGKCHLNKTLKKAEQAKGNENSLQNLNLSFEFTSVSNEFVLLNPSIFSLQKYFTKNCYNSSDFFTSLNKPPIVA